MKTCMAAMAYSILLVIFVGGCSLGESRAKPPGINAHSAGLEAVKLYDTDGNGLLSREELKKCPGLLAAFRSYDADRDNQISATEVTTRIEAWQATKIAMASLSCTVKQGGRPLVGATVRFVPEPYLGTDIKTATGTTDEDGTTIVRVADDDLPESMRGVPGIHYGTFRVEITHPSTDIPAKYNQQSILGHEIAHDIGNPYASFDL